MAFNFGGVKPATPAAATPAVATAANGLASGFSFGSSATGKSPAAPTTNNTSQAPPTTFGSTPASKTTGTSSAPAGGFSFGNNSTGTNNTAQAPPTTFGSTPASKTARTSSAPTGGFSFSNNSTSATNAPQTGALVPSIGNSLSSNSSNTIVVPKITDVFPYVSILSKIRNLQDTNSRFASEELVALIQKYNHVLSKPPPPTVTLPDNNKRQRLQSNPNVDLNGRPAALTPDMLQEVYSIADTLYLSEEDTMALYAEASQVVTRDWLEDMLKITFQSVPEAAKELYFLQRRSLMQSILLLCQCRLQGGNGELPFVELTDELLRNDLLINLVALIRKLSENISQLVERQKSSGASVNNQNSKTGTNTMLEVWMHHMQRERQIAAESIFYLTYSAQCTEQEVVALVDLVQEVTNSTHLPNLDPFKDVPEPYHSGPEPQPWTGPFTQALPALQEKNTWEWERELVQETTKKGDGGILPTVSILVLAVVCALDTRQILIDRNTHLPNNFGRGNALFQNPDNTIRGSLHDRFKSCDSNWNRKDIWGILSAAYALGLRPIKAVVTSPRAQPVVDGVKRTWKACLAAPCENKSFTCLRLTLLPSIRRHKTMLDERCELYEFCLSVLSEFMALYLDVLCASDAVPLSRAKWADTENETLQFKREEQERERSFYMSYGGGTYTAKEAIPSGVNLLERPDCVDDVIALATALCSRGPTYAASFWSRDGDKMVPSRALKKLEFLQEKDSSLIPTHLSFLAALATAEPSVVFDILNKESSGNDKVMMNWTTIFTTIRWYVHKMSDAYAGEVKPMQKESPATSVSTSYYYKDEDDLDTDISRSNNKQVDVSRSSRLKELDETNTAIVLSHLGVITKVADNYGAGRATLVSMQLSIGDSAVADEDDSILLVLFSLAIAPLTPYVRGAVLATIASLLSIEGNLEEKEKKMIESKARRGWDLLELIQAVPVLLLDQYQRTQQGLKNPMMVFPPSSISVTNNGATKSWLPADPKYGIIFEMEHVESRLGFYPSTEGLLQLLLSLVRACGCPHILGQEEHGKPGRFRPGCTPYIEYIVNFVLPRALGSHRVADKLPFKTGVDSARLVARALAVLEAVLIRYTIPSKAGMKLQENLDAATSLLKMREVATKLITSPSKDDIASFELDFRSKQTSSISENANASVSLPRIKSPGYYILTDILAASNSELLRVISHLLTLDGGSEGINTIYGSADLQYRVTWARFGDTMPSVFSAKHKQESSHSITRQSLLARFLPPIDVAIGNKDSLDPIYWRANGILTSLRILGAAAIREQDFIKAVSGVATVVPALQFKAKVNVVQKKEIHLVRIRNAISGTVSPEIKCLSSIAQYLTSICSDESEDTEISGAALGLLVYSFAAFNSDACLSALDAQSIHGELQFTRAVAERLTIACQKTSSKFNAEIVRTILILLQSELSNILLGFPHKSVDGLRTDGILPSPHLSKQNECLSVLVDCLSDDNFLINPGSSGIAVKVFELIVCLSSTNDASLMGRVRADHLSNRLNSIDFWNNTAFKFLAYRSSNQTSLLEAAISAKKDTKGSENLIHGAAWFLEGLADHFMKNIQVTNQNSLSQQNQILLGNLLDKEYHLLCNAIDCLSKCNEASQLNFPTSLLPLQQTFESCMYSMDDSHHLSGYMLVNKEDLRKKIMHFNTDESPNEVYEKSMEWVEEWNRCTRWDYANLHFSRSVINLIEASLEFSSWSLQSGAPNLLHNSDELSIAREHNLLILLDKILDILVEQDQINTTPSQLSKPLSTTLSTEVLMMVERLLSESRDRTSLPHFIPRIGMAAVFSLNSSGINPLTIDDEERSIVLGSALCQCLKAENIENEEVVKNIISKVAAAFGPLSCRQVKVDANSDIEQRRFRASLASQSILSSLARSTDRAGSGVPNPIVFALATTPCASSTSKNILQALLDTIPTLDINNYPFLETLSSCEGGANLILKMGILKAFFAASENIKKMIKTNQLDYNGTHMKDLIPSFTGTLGLMRSLLISLPSSVKTDVSLREEFQNLLVSNNMIICHVGSSFPMFGECWLDIVQVLALTLPTRKDAASQIRFGNVLSGNVESSSLSQSIDKIVGYVVKITENLIQYPFPDRLQPILPKKLQDKPDSVESWWKEIEHINLAEENIDKFPLPDPPTGLTFGWTRPDTISNDKYGSWTRQKYETCLAGAHVMDASLTILLNQLGEESVKVLEFNSTALARGLCRLADSSEAIILRLRDIEQFTGDRSMVVSTFDEGSKESVKIERDVLKKLCCLLGRNCEKLLMLSYNIYQKMNLINEEFHAGLPSNPSPEMQAFKDIMLLALEHTRLKTKGVRLHPDESEGSKFSWEVAEKLQDILQGKI